MLFVIGCGPGKEQILLPDGGFESRGLEDWDIEKSVEGASYGLSVEDARGGHRCLLLKSMKEGTDIFALKKELDVKPSRFEYLKLSAYIKEKSDCISRISLSTYVEGEKKTSYSPYRAKDEDQWYEVEAKIFVPEHTEKLEVRCLVYGKGEACFDDLKLEEIDWELGIPMQFEAPGIARVAGARDYTIDKDAEEFEFVFPLPMLTDYQVPLNFRFEINPADKILFSKVFHRAGPNWNCKITIGPVKKGDTIEFRFWSDVFMIKADFSGFPQKAPIPDADVYPEDVKMWLQATISVQSDHEKIQAEAQQILENADGSDAITFIRTMLDSIKKIKIGNPRGVDALSMFEHGGWCTSHANLGASLCRAVGIPARVIANYPIENTPFQTHYIIEAYINGYGWIPVETSYYQFPWQPYKQVYISQVQIQDEQDSFAENRSMASNGVPKWSLTEADGRLFSWNIEKRQPFGYGFNDHIASPMIQYDKNEKVIEIFQIAKDIWTKYQDAKSGKTEYPGLVKALEGEMKPVPKTLEAFLLLMNKYSHSYLSISAKERTLESIYRSGKVRFIPEVVLDDEATPDDVFFEGYEHASSIVVDEKDNVYIADLHANHIKVFDKTGIFLKTIGREGQGPGEFNMPYTMAYSNGRLVIWNMRNMCFTIITTDGEHIKTRALKHFEEGWPTKMRALPNGDILVETRKQDRNDLDNYLTSELRMYSPEMEYLKWSTPTSCIIENS
jgi:hypothetical protein